MPPQPALPTPNEATGDTSKNAIRTINRNQQRVPYYKLRQQDVIDKGLNDDFDTKELATAGSCSICLELFLSEDLHRVVQISRCGHVFHKRCITPSLQSDRPNNHTCPNCRVKLFLPQWVVNVVGNVPGPSHPEHARIIERVEKMLEIGHTSQRERPINLSTADDWANYALSPTLRHILQRSRVRRPEELIMEYVRDGQGNFRPRYGRPVPASFESQMYTDMRAPPSLAPNVVNPSAMRTPQVGNGGRPQLDSQDTTAASHGVYQAHGQHDAVPFSNSNPVHTNLQDRRPYRRHLMLRRLESGSSQASKNIPRPTNEPVPNRPSNSQAHNTISNPITTNDDSPVPAHLSLEDRVRQGDFSARAFEDAVQQVPAYIQRISASLPPSAANELFLEQMRRVVCGELQREAELRWIAEEHRLAPAILKEARLGAYTLASDMDAQIRARESSTRPLEQRGITSLHQSAVAPIPDLEQSEVNTQKRNETALF